MLSKENAALLLGELRKRSDFQLHNTPVVTIHNGQSMSTGRKRPRSYAKAIVWNNSIRRHELSMTNFSEGYKLEISPIRSLDGKSMDALIKCNVDQIEKLRDVAIDVPTQFGKPEKVKIQVPQIVSWRLVERFQWPVDKVLLLSAGVVASPETDAKRLPRFLNQDARRSDALLFIDCKGPLDTNVVPKVTKLPRPPEFRIQR